MNAPSKKPQAAQTAENVLDEMDARMRIWNAVSKTDPKHTKRVNQRGGFTAIDAQYQIMEATRQFGPIGEGWGYNVGEYNIVGSLIIVPVTLWHGTRDKYFGPVLGCAEIINGQRADRDAPKKAITDAVTKGLSQLGFNADVFLGLFDDNKYVAEITKHFAPEEPKPTPRKDGDMSDTALRGSIKTLIHNIHGCASLRDFEELLELEEAKETVEQCARRFPHWWETGEGLPAEFTPLKKIIQETRAGLKALEEENA